MWKLIELHVSLLWLNASDHVSIYCTQLLCVCRQQCNVYKCCFIFLSGFAVIASDLSDLWMKWFNLLTVNLSVTTPSDLCPSWTRKAGALGALLRCFSLCVLALIKWPSWELWKVWGSCLWCRIFLKLRPKTPTQATLFLFHISFDGGCYCRDSFINEERNWR